MYIRELRRDVTPDQENISVVVVRNIDNAMGFSVLKVVDGCAVVETLIGQFVLAPDKRNEGEFVTIARSPRDVDKDSVRTELDLSTMLVIHEIRVQNLERV